MPKNFNRDIEIFYKMKQKKVTTHSACLPAVFTIQCCHLQLTGYYMFLHLCQLAEVTNERAEGISSPHIAGGTDEQRGEEAG